ncbi:hypothetical protein F2P81_023243 [Scophthalmus maximus]|uniref:Endothelin-1 n=1 Tax=Scophthalmus maximus TaxID=52904 RepID=A0A6A4RZP8_SCOMX|nr:hypothetical protein F2P81_023243 [Scophthalmus maximus]
MYSWSLCTVLSAPAGGETAADAAVSAVRHVRNKRCSCATFLDKECVYFCHLDIIWVNTPERVVSYGLGNAPRTKRALADSMATAPRCQCLREKDNTCTSFCRPDQRLRSETRHDSLILSAEGEGCAGTHECKHTLAADTSRIKRTRSSRKKQGSPPAPLAVALKTRLLLEKWRVRAGPPKDHR